MNRALKNFGLTLFLAILLDMFLPWWSIMIAAICAAFIFPTKGLKVFFTPFMAIFIYWAIYAFILGSANEFTLTRKIGILFTLGDNWVAVLLITSIIGGVAAGISGIFGKQLSSTLSYHKSKY